MEVLRGANIEKGAYVEKRGFTKDGETFYLKLKGNLEIFFTQPKREKLEGWM